MLDVSAPGLATTVQDLGRPGYYHLGIPISGAMDRHAIQAGNILVGNQPDVAALEIVFMGPELAFADRRVVAVTGAELPPKVDGEVRPTWTPFVVEAGQILSFDFIKSGARAYLAIGGGIDVPQVLGSRSTYVLGALGGLDGRKLQQGDRLALCPASADMPRLEWTVPENLRRPVLNPGVLRVLPGLYDFRLTSAATEGFYADTWKVAPDADRTGYRFRGGRPLEFQPREQPFGAGSDPSNIVDACYPYGSIQVPNGAEPIVLHRDAVTAGGYFTLGTVISADMNLIGQMQPHQKVRFERVSMSDALAARREERERLSALRRLLDT
ncbi:MULTISPECIES: biotin-dependent carboxyltransferase family protein [Agrobacterium]|uniref:Biotin-dependent carboxyltransferase n=1 Tax=Agrobacterium rubi TaxID=28099 RepID=A0AAE7R7S0_9HYPH|nr:MULTISPECIES: biotin-dependent carboxyltransferase family protein [Agrobacterium]MBN7808935.1 biotin-dependent carboxyltransferase [Agrobacterium rosae]NTE89863.1 biotin-dependent carboxyltransferase [Agrobacterium rubi]NTF05287.1 biotin-dependent carboxyltransferase [Agrobacterium rubi]NTF10539.1 biotin-dependent carboxyltransferase [Agrobacterium rubi]NTF22933.1 biotin-dependent carboxyltransferase [Agrobacterium rubi]